MCYFTEPMSDYFVRVISEKNPGRWQTQKFRGEKAHTDGIRFNVSRCDASHDDVRTGTG